MMMQKVDAVIGDTTITANRSSYVDFTLPYLESGVAMVVAIKDDERRNMWIFLKPLSWNLWLTTCVAFISTGFVVWLLEHRTNEEFRGRRRQQLSMIFWFSFSTLVFAHSKSFQNYRAFFVILIFVEVFSTVMASILYSAFSVFARSFVSNLL